MSAPLPNGFLQKLACRLGASHVLDHPADLAPVLTEWRGLYTGEAVALAKPADADETAFVLKECHEAGIPVTPQSGRTGLVGGGVPQGGIVVSLARINRLRAVEPLNGAMIVEAGCILQDVRRAADEAGMLFPLSLASEGSCMIGGTLAGNAGGMAVLRYGTMRDLTLGLEVVLPDGRIWNGLKRLRKNNMGYDLKNLFIGSEGTLGIITAAALKLFPKPKATATAFIGCARPEKALDLFAMMQSLLGETLTAYEYINSFALDLSLKHGGGVRPFAPSQAYVLIEAASTGQAESLRKVVEEAVSAAFEAGLIEQAVLAEHSGQARALQALREGISEAQSREGGSIKHDVSVPMADLAAFLAAAGKACEREMPGIRVCAFGHFGDGNIHFNLSQPIGMEKTVFLAQWSRFNRIVHDIVAAMDGSIAAEHGIGLLKRDELALYGDPVGLDMMRAVKSALDPKNTMNPGKIYRTTI